MLSPMRKSRKRRHTKQTRQIIENIAMATSLLSVVLWLSGTGQTPDWLRIVLASVATVIVVTASIRWIGEWRREGIGSQPVLGFDKPESEADSYSISGVKIKSDIGRVIEFESRFFPDEAFEVSRVEKMWLKSTDSIAYAENYKTGEVISIAGLWPITKSAYEDMIQGVRDEGELQVGDIVSRSPKQYWWFSCIATEEKYRKKFPELTAAMLNFSFAVLSKHVDSTKEMGLVTTALTSHGAKLASRLGMASRNGKSTQLFTMEGPASEVLEKLLSRAVPPTKSPD